MEAGRLSKGALSVGWLIVVALATVIAPDVALAGDGSFAEAGLPLAAASGQFATAIGDFNNDGDQDLANVGLTDKNVRVALGGAGAAFGGGNGGDSAVNGAGVVEGSFNNDSKADLAVANFADGGGISILTGNGNGGFTRVRDLPASWAFGLVAGDFNSDGTTDLISMTEPGGIGTAEQITLYYGKGGADFEAPRYIGQVGPNLTPRLATGDFDGNGADDLALLAVDSTPGENELFIYRNRSTPTNLDWGISVPAPYPVGGTHLGIGVGDFNADGDPDIAVTARGGVKIFAGSTGVTFTDQGTTLATAGDPSFLTVGDLNSDGDDDLAVTSTDSKAEVNTFLGATGFSFTRAPGSPFAPPSGAGGDLAVGDFDQDGNEDLVSTTDRT